MIVNQRIFNSDIDVADDILGRMGIDGGGGDNPNSGNNDAATAQAAEAARIAASKSATDLAATIDAAKLAEANAIADNKDDNNSVDNEGDNADNVSLVNSIITKIGFIVKDELGNAKEYPDTEEGLQTYFDDIEPLRKEAVLRDIEEQHPAIKKFVNHIIRGGSEDSYFKVNIENDWNRIKIDEETSEVFKKETLIKGYVEQGINKAKAELLVDTLIKTGNLDLEVEDMLQDRRKAQSIRDAEHKAQELAADKAAREEAMTTLNKVRETVTKGNLTTNIAGNILIPEVDRRAFLDYITKPVDKQGNTQSVIDARNLNLDSQLLIDYLHYKKFNIDGLIKKAASADKVLSLKQRLAQANSNSGEQRKQEGSNGSVASLDSW